MHIKFQYKLLSLLLSLLFSCNIFAVRLKIAVIAPDGSSWAKNLKKMVKEITVATNGKVKWKIYFGAIQGDEPAVLRKIIIGQLHGGVFTGKTLGDINGDIRVLELPFTFNDTATKPMKILSDMGPFLNKGLNQKGFFNLGFFGIGEVYFVSKVKVSNMDSMKGVKIWSWQGDDLVQNMIDVMGLVSVPLAITDVLSSLSSTGASSILDAAYAPPLGLMALQWNTKIKYLVDFPIAYSVGAFLLSKKTWKKIPLKYHAKIKQISAKYIQKINADNIKDNQESLDIIKNMGVEFVKFPKSDIIKSKQIRKDVIQKLTGKLFSKTAVLKLEQQLKIK